MRNATETAARPTVGLFGFGGFGQLIADHLAPHVDLRIHDPYTSVFGGVSLIEAAEADVVILSVPVSEVRGICEDIGDFLKPGAMVVDVGSVKISPIADMVECLPDHVQIVGTHPLFGPQSAKAGIAGHNIALCPVRGSDWRMVRSFLSRVLKLRVITCTPEEHDKEAAMVQGLTHLIAKVITEMGPLPTRMTTASFELLSQAIEMVKDDPPTVLQAIEASNPFAAQVRAQFFERAERLKETFESADFAAQNCHEQRNDPFIGVDLHAKTGSMQPIIQSSFKTALT
ncbi:prephenate dehydrogenase [Cognatishimia activa]|uniref:Arogenate dehydrogenase n=1 Tax=Cognatishimia activa TaxID=1715691 RepID=A0A0P1ISL3_9RHOB|nr:prephenate dehydrogenase [Cognatishimia activa]CUI67093.1 Arogenate dehydrogenase [Cognatishimia activa]CUK26468.1 Arogenate dehydrogenase [Cognatishimia activa]